MTTSEKYVTAAYLVFLAVILLYVVVYSTKIARLEREVALHGDREEAGEA
jgi:hypothetical protein